MTELNKVFQTTKDAYETASSYYNELCDTIDGFIDTKNDIRTIMLLSDSEENYSWMMEECKESIALLRRIEEVFGPVVEQLELAYKNLKENEKLLKRGE